MLGTESPFVPKGASYTEFSSNLMTELEGMAKKVDKLLEEECHDLFSVTATRIFIHLLLRDPHFKLEDMIGPVPEDARGDLAASIEAHVRMLLKVFSCDNDEEPDKEPPALP
ncbi:hypothetical protein D1007_09676 [Hordeum vulgare]|nr:hypothetical protein D1007_09676 [Hordeum vulgare]